ncbi:MULTISPECIES: IPT/TIG domain-containing protein [unclassified Streptomyces]|uniref:IPT/TIG domain-containing protein n=1 Tax=unclassified Streptomyces TaxID=2593676 RepID=UPI00081EEFF7|nr:MULTISPECIES: IPT/TIG domain-containing protein [unclassified Streptomyces]MYZ34786.1 cell surface protein [Streptomyces sp. SID4917]SCF70238.1 IPT/TIG domain-containing protein [Streptomyces sp. MnatMP-M17]
MPISPSQGSTGGGNTVTITGTNLAGATAVHFGSKLATITANTATSVTVIAPSGTGTVGVTVTTPGGTSNPVTYFYVGAPFKSGLSPVSGVTAGGNTVTITGTGLSTATSVAFGTVTAVPTVVSDSQITVTVPEGVAAGPVGVSVTTAGGTNNGLSYTYIDGPTIGTPVPASGPVAGGTAVTLPGTDLATTQSVTVGGVAAPFAVISNTTLTFVTPPAVGGTPGAVDIVVTTSGGSATGTGAFTYVAGPGI